MADLSSTSAILPTRSTLSGHSVKLEPLESRHATDLFKHLCGANRDVLWRWMPDTPYEDYAVFAAALDHKVRSQDPFFFAVVDQSSGEAVGHLSFLRIDLQNRVVEIGHVIYSVVVQRSRVTTECIYLLLKYAFEELHFRRCEWKCNNLNEPSKRAAARFGFTYEGVFRQHMIVKGLNRDTAWYSIIDGEWPAVRSVFEHWLDPDNFDAEGKQRKTLNEVRQGQT